MMDSFSSCEDSCISSNPVLSRSNSIYSSLSSASMSSCRNYVVSIFPYMENTNFSTLLMGKKPTRETLGSGVDVETESTMYIDYPPSKPFVNDEYERPPYKTVSKYPEGNRKAVINALKNLQGRIHQLEADRTAAEDNLKSLATETSKYSDILQKDNERRPPKQTLVSKQNQELESQLSAAEMRCNLLEKQLDHMKNMVDIADKEKTAAVKKAILIESEPKPSDPMSPDFQSNLRKIAELEREHIKLTANQSLAESKIRELEEKLGEERLHHKLMIEKSAEIESVRKANEILNNVENDYIEEYKPVKQKRPVKKKKKVVSKKTGHPECRKSDPSKHYRLNLADIPFVAGKNTGPSHSVGANVQKVFALMKSHNMALCDRTSYPVDSYHTPNQGSSGSVSPTTESDLAEILLQLQDEFHRMSFEHQEYSKEISDTADPRIREDLERELDSLVARMEAKSQQISKIRRYQEKMANKKKKKAKSPKLGDTDELPRRPRSAQSCSPRVSRSHKYNGEVEVTTTIKPKGAGTGVVQIRPSSARQISLNVLKDMKKLQSTLRKDDLSWDC